MHYSQVKNTDLFMSMGVRIASIRTGNHRIIHGITNCRNSGEFVVPTKLPCHVSRMKGSIVLIILNSITEVYTDASECIQQTAASSPSI